MMLISLLFIQFSSESLPIAPNYKQHLSCNVKSVEPRERGTRKEGINKSASCMVSTHFKLQPKISEISMLPDVAKTSL
jgi:hypothetical protein